MAGVKLVRRCNLGAPKGVGGRNSDNTLIRELLGWEPDIPLRTGLKADLSWVRDQMMAVPTPGRSTRGAHRHAIPSLSRPGRGS
jgi:GDP-D-mannose 3', 5'-epimerase